MWSPRTDLIEITAVDVIDVKADDARPRAWTIARGVVQAAWREKNDWTTWWLAPLCVVLLIVYGAMWVFWRTVWVVARVVLPIVVLFIKKVILLITWVILPIVWVFWRMVYGARHCWTVGLVGLVSPLFGSRIGRQLSSPIVASPENRRGFQRTPAQRGLATVDRLAITITLGCLFGPVVGGIFIALALAPLILLGKIGEAVGWGASAWAAPTPALVIAVLLIPVSAVALPTGLVRLIIGRDGFRDLVNG
jgi:hypothetical protein